MNDRKRELDKAYVNGIRDAKSMILSLMFRDPDITEASFRKIIGMFDYMIKSHKGPIDERGNNSKSENKGVD